MFGKIRSRFSSAHLIAVAALVFAIGGGSALALVGKNTVDSGDIKNGAVKSADVRNNNLKSKDYRNNSVKGADVDESTLACGAIPNADCSADDVTEGGGAPGTPGASGSTVFAFRAQADAERTFVFDGLTITASCASNGFLDVLAETNTNNSFIYTYSVDVSASPGTIDNENQNADFDTTDAAFDLLDEDNNNQLGHTKYAAGASGPIVDLEWASDNDGSSGSDCVFVGHAMV
jgi:hypothetical protein